MRSASFIVIGLLFLMALPALGASSYLGGFSGIILTPDDVIVPTQTWEGSFHDTLGLLGGSKPDLLTVGLSYGLMPNLEVGASYITDDTNRIAVSGKYRVVTESANTPGITVGVFDVAGSVDFLSNNASFYLLLSKNITPLASDVAGQPSKPLRMCLGFGTGFYNGLIANLDWTLAPRLSLLAEYKGGNDGIEGLENGLSAGVRWAATDSLRLDAAIVGFRDIGLGLSGRSKF
jgi:hypothetical protein